MTRSTPAGGVPVSAPRPAAVGPRARLFQAGRGRLTTLKVPRRRGETGALHKTVTATAAATATVTAGRPQTPQIAVPDPPPPTRQPAALPATSPRARRRQTSGEQRGQAAHHTGRPSAYRAGSWIRRSSRVRGVGVRGGGAAGQSGLCGDRVWTARGVVRSRARRGRSAALTVRVTVALQMIAAQERPAALLAHVRALTVIGDAGGGPRGGRNVPRLCGTPHTHTRPHTHRDGTAADRHRGPGTSPHSRPSTGGPSPSD